MDRDIRLKRLRFRACHRGTKEADFMVGGFFEHYHAEWGETEIVWFEALMNEEDVDIMGWALGTISVPEHWQGPMMGQFQRLDYIDVENMGG